MISTASHHSNQGRSLRVRPGRPETYFAEEKGALVIVRPDKVFVFRARPAELWVQGEEDRTWRRSNGDELSLSWGNVLRSALRSTDESNQNHLPPAVASRQALEHEEVRKFSNLMDSRVIRETVRWRDHEWRICEFLSTGKAALELAETNPGLAFGLALLDRVTSGRAEDSVQAAARMAGEKRRRICTSLLLPDSAAVVRVLSRVPRATLDCDNFLRLRGALQESKTAALLGHVRRINAGVISLVSDLRLQGYLTSAFLDDVGDAYEYDVSGEGLCAMVSRYSKFRAAEKREAGNTLRDLHHLHTYLARFQFGPESWQPHEYCEFPPPPIEGIAEIEPLTCCEALICEGRDQGNCVGSPGYAHEICRGGTYFYAVHNPQRCTLQIHLDPVEGFWKVLQLSARFNDDLAPDTLTAVRCWLSAGNAVLEKRSLEVS